MAATTTAFNNLLKQLTDTLPSLRFVPGDEFRWSPSTQTIWYPTGTTDTVTLLHETAHGLLAHTGYTEDIELLHLEREAWNKATKLGLEHHIAITDGHIETALDTYRDWLHARSLCPTCHHTGVQEADGQYQCVVCGQRWHVNDARHCGLKRQKL